MPDASDAERTTAETKWIMFGDIVEENGKTIRENNRAIAHKIPIGTLVEVKFHSWFGEGACWKVHARLWVVEHNRDCDGTPLYVLSRWKDGKFARSIREIHGGFSEDSLTPIDVTPELLYGTGALEWPEAR